MCDNFFGAHGVAPRREPLVGAVRSGTRTHRAVLVETTKRWPPNKPEILFAQLGRAQKLLLRLPTGLSGYLTTSNYAGYKAVTV